MRVRPRPSGKPDSSGSILITCLILLSTLAVYGAVLVSVVYERSLNIQLELDRIQALYLAESALAKSMHELKSMRDTDSDGLGTIPETPFGRGKYYATHDPGTFAIIGVGEVNNVSRSIRIKYQGM